MCLIYPAETWGKETVPQITSPRGLGGIPVFLPATNVDCSRCWDNTDDSGLCPQGVHRWMRVSPVSVGTGGYDKESRFTPEEVHAGPSMGQ